MALNQTFTATTILPLPREAVFAFFADPRNLERLTPPWLSFRVLTPEPLPVGEGAVYDYVLRLHGLPVRWRTLITAWEEGHGFEDLQVKGPYALWHHRHTFEDTPEGGTPDDRHGAVPAALRLAGGPGPPLGAARRGADLRLPGGGAAPLGEGAGGLRVPGLPCHPW